MIHEQTFQSALFLRKLSIFVERIIEMLSEKTIAALGKLRLKALLFDMDGVLFNSMPHHAKAWVHTFECIGIEFNEYEAYMREGMTGNGTINELFNKTYGRNATKEECDELYAIKSDYFDSLGKADPIDNVDKVLTFAQKKGLEIYIVTGSGQKSLLTKLNSAFPGIFSEEKMVTAYDVKKGKPDPEPYLMALKKGGFDKHEAIVIENAPLGVTAGHAAGIFTIAVNTGILKDEELTSRGADLLFHNMSEFFDVLPEIVEISSK